MARALTDEHQIRSGVANAKNDSGAAFVKATAGALAKCLADLIQCFAFNPIQRFEKAGGLQNRQNGVDRRSGVECRAGEARGSWRSFGLYLGRKRWRRYRANQGLAILVKRSKSQ